jgi:putative glutamine amidotransferase
VQHIEGHRYPEQQEVHPITIASHSRLRSILEVDEFVVNSRHHQCVDQVASGLVVVARAPDNVVEALELPGKRFVLAVQRHPENRAGGPDVKLFEAFRDATKLSGERWDLSCGGRPEGSSFPDGDLWPTTPLER